MLRAARDKTDHDAQVSLAFSLTPLARHPAGLSFFPTPRTARMMRTIAILLALVALPALAYDVTATMPATAGATSCQLYLGGTATGVPRPCGSAQSYPALIANPGTYLFSYRAINASGQTALSPVRTVAIGVIPPPADPTDPPTMTIVCNPAPCSQSIVITITP